MSARKPKRQAKAQPKAIRKVVKLYPGYHVVQLPADWPCDLDEANLALEEVMGILDMVTNLNLREPPSGLDSVLMTALNSAGRAKDAIFGKKVPS